MNTFARNKEKKSLKVDQLNIIINETAKELGMAAANFVQNSLEKTISEKGGANLILATGASQFEFLGALKEMSLDWTKITVFHLDEYKDIADTHPASFRKYLKERILDTVKPKETYFLKGDAKNVYHEMERYSEALKKNPIDVACIGIGENGHIAFNDPHVADFDDPKEVKLVTLDDACRNQQLGEGWFKTIEDVPKQALTLTITAIMNCNVISCAVPGERKAEAVHNTLKKAISTHCPASILRNHKNAHLFLDSGSASKL